MGDDFVYMRAEIKSEKNRIAIVRHKLRILHELGIPEPPQSDIERISDASRTSLYDVDVYFRSIISRFFGD